MVELPEGSADPVELAARCEDGTDEKNSLSLVTPTLVLTLVIYKELRDTGMKYRNRIRSRVSNLKDAKNPTLRVNVLLGLITPERLAVLTAEVRSPCASFTIDNSSLERRRWPVMP